MLGDQRTMFGSFTARGKELLADISVLLVGCKRAVCGVSIYLSVCSSVYLFIWAVNHVEFHSI